KYKLLDLIYSRYADVSFIMDASLDDGLGLCIDALEGRNEERLFQRWVLEGCSKTIPFQEFKNHFKPKKPMTQKEKDAAKKRIDANVIRINAKFSSKAVKTHEVI
ncbi:MAG: hypothetical protein ACQ5SW_05985, partial [Sphaerochaetaceae bacterium]